MIGGQSVEKLLVRGHPSDGKFFADHLTRRVLEVMAPATWPLSSSSLLQPFWLEMVGNLAGCSSPLDARTWAEHASRLRTHQKDAEVLLIKTRTGCEPPSHKEEGVAPPPAPTTQQQICPADSSAACDRFLFSASTEFLGFSHTLFPERQDCSERLCLSGSAEMILDRLPRVPQAVKESTLGSVLTGLVKTAVQKLGSILSAAGGRPEAVSRVVQKLEQILSGSDQAAEARERIGPTRVEILSNWAARAACGLAPLANRSAPIDGRLGAPVDESEEGIQKTGAPAAATPPAAGGPPPLFWDPDCDALLQQVGGEQEHVMVSKQQVAKKIETDFKQLPTISQNDLSWDQRKLIDTLSLDAHQLPQSLCGTSGTWKSKQRAVAAAATNRWAASLPSHQRPTSERKVDPIPPSSSAGQQHSLVSPPGGRMNFDADFLLPGRLIARMLRPPLRDQQNEQPEQLQQLRRTAGRRLNILKHLAGLKSADAQLALLATGGVTRETRELFETGAIDRSRWDGWQSGSMGKLATRFLGNARLLYWAEVARRASGGLS